MFCIEYVLLREESNMFCPKCGTKLNDDAIFCQHCGAKLNALINTSFSNKPRLYNDELNRDALKIYLGDILSLECIKNKLRIKYNKINKEIASVQDYQKYKMDHSYNLWVHLFYKDGIEYIAMKKYVDRVAVWDWLPPDYEWMSIDNNMNFLKSTEAWGDVACSSNFITAHFEKKSAINDFLHIYKDFKKCAPLAHQENLKKINLLTKKKNGLAREFNEANDLLQKAYQINIIPGTFRNNLYAIYYFYDFIRTSRESFSTALLHFDLNEIKAKLDTIIAQQQEIIIQQAILTSQNQELLNQNKMQLNKLSHIESNTSRAAQYAEIAANNAAACAWISLANYIDK